MRRQKIAELLISVSHVGVPRCALYRKGGNLGKNGWVGGAGSGGPRAAKSGQPANPFLLNPLAQSLAHAPCWPWPMALLRSSSGPCWPASCPRFFYCWPSAKPLPLLSPLAFSIVKLHLQHLLQKLRRVCAAPSFASPLSLRSIPVDYPSPA